MKYAGRKQHDDKAPQRRTYAADPIEHATETSVENSQHQHHREKEPSHESLLSRRIAQGMPVCATGYERKGITE